MRSIKYYFILIIILFVSITSSLVFAQDKPGSLIQSSATDTISSSRTLGELQQDTGKRGFSIKTMYELFQIAEGFGYLLAFVFILGILFIFQKWFVLIRERKDAHKIPVNEIKIMSYDDIRKMLTQIKEDTSGFADNENTEKEKIPLLKRIFRRKKATAFQLISKLYRIFDAQRSTSAFNEETSNFVQYLKDMFNPFMTKLSFLSDTAGALGLLGTVWGMFLVFYRGSPDPDDILRGMGIALSTTIIGLVISIILNSFTTVISNLFDRHLDFVNNLATVFHERLMKEEDRQPMKAQPIIVDSLSLSDRLQPVSVVKDKQTQIVEDNIVEEQTTVPIITPDVYGPPSGIKIISGDNQTGEVNTQLAEPIIVEVRDVKGNSLENETVVFTAEDGAGIFPNNNRAQKILTDEDGRAQTQLTLGKTAGEKTIHISVDGSNIRGVKLLAIAKPTPPAKLVELGGNYQTGELGRRLPIPFSVAIRDKYDNPIPMYGVDFSLRKGSGKFQDTQNAHFIAYTNENGLVEVYFIIGHNRGAREIEVAAKKVQPSKVLFEAFGV